MSKLKITIERKEEQVKTCKHEVGGVYKDGGDYYILARNDDGSVNCIWLNDFKIGIGFNSVEHLDHMGPSDIPVDAELIIREVQ